VTTNAYLRRLHNFALDMNWLLAPVLPPKKWPKVKHAKKRAITQGEHARILAREGNSERRAFYALLWHLGGSQTDVACLRAENIDFTNSVIGYQRAKLDEVETHTGAWIRFGPDVETLLRTLPAAGPLFPYLATVDCKDRATEFKQRCDGLGIDGVTLHSYRYAWAERAKKAGMPERYAQVALGHASKAVHRAYARGADVTVPSLEDYERIAEEKIVNVSFQKSDQPSTTQHPKVAVAVTQ
jgi:integrase